MTPLARGDRFRLSLSPAMVADPSEPGVAGAAVTCVVAYAEPFPGSAAMAERGVLDPDLVADAVLVRIGPLITGTWVRRDALQAAAAGNSEEAYPLSPRPGTGATDVEPPPVVTGDGPGAHLVWGPIVRPLSIDQHLTIPEGCRPRVHGLRELARLVLLAGRRPDLIRSALWRDPAFDVPWGDLRRTPVGHLLLDMAGLDPSLGYREHLAACA